MRLNIREFLSGFTRNFWIIVITWVIFRVSYSLTFPYLSNYIIALGGDEASIGLVRAVESFMLALIVIPGGYIADIYGRKKIVVRFTWLIVLATLLYVIAPAWWFIVLALAIEGLVRIYIPALRALFADSIKPGYRGRANILSEILPEVVAIPFPLIAGYVIATYGDYNPLGYRLLFLASFFISLLAAILRQFFLTETIRVKETSFFKALSEGFRRGYTDIVNTLPKLTRHVKLILVLEVVLALTVGLTEPYFIRYAFLNGYESKSWGALLTALSAAYVVCSLIIFPFIDRIPHKESLIGTAALSSVALFIFSLGGWNYVTIGYSLWWVIGGILWIAFARVAIDVTPRAVRGRVNALQMLISNILHSVGNLIAAAIYVKNPQAVFMLASLILLMAIPVTTAIPKIEKIEE